MLTPIYQCGLCAIRGHQKGCRYRRVRGVRTKVCGPCAERLARPACEDAPPTRPTVGGSATQETAT